MTGLSSRSWCRCCSSFGASPFSSLRLPSRDVDAGMDVTTSPRSRVVNRIGASDSFAVISNAKSCPAR